MQPVAMELNGRHRLEIGSRTTVMGILNVTPDSFSDGGIYFSTEDAVRQGLKMASDGADIIDIGGESTRPFSEPVPEDEELNRVIPVISSLAKQLTIPISIDTMKATVAKRAIESGASIINDISALRHDKTLIHVAAESGVPVILMHMKGSPKSMQINPVYDDVVEDVAAFLDAAIQRAVDGGVKRSRIIVDPGIGFGKTVQHNLLLLKHLARFQVLNVPILVGSSRKKFIRTLLKRGDADDIPADRPVISTGTQATVAAAILNGAAIVRVHDVSQTKATARIIDAIRDAGNARGED
jgi:dihydropteroate synthase